MPDPSENQQPSPDKAFIHLDVDKLMEIFHVGVRRASAFMTFGRLAEASPLPDNFDLGAGSVFSFWPKDLTSETRSRAREEFISWVSGSCLRELDQYFAHFLDKVWFYSEVGLLHGQRVHSSHVIDDDRFAKNTNVANKLRQISSRLGSEFHIDCFESLSKARNALAHGIGKVRERDMNEGSRLVIRWCAPHTVIEDGAQEISFRNDIVDTYQVKSPEGASIYMKFEKFECAFELGQRIIIPERFLAEICFFYQQQAAAVGSALHNFLSEKLAEKSTDVASPH